MEFDIIIIGGGPAGYTAAIAAAKKNMKVALVEKDSLGGTCLNRGCIPTKAILHTAKLYWQLKHHQQKGINYQDLSYGSQQAYINKDEIVSRLLKGIKQLLDANKITIYHDEATLASEHEILLINNDQLLKGEYIIIATGTNIVRLPFINEKLKHIYTSDDLLKTPIKEKQVTIIGGGVVGCELATYLYQTDHDVSIIELTPSLLPGVDRELSQSLQMNLRKNGVNIITNARVSSCANNDDALVITYQKDEQTLIHHTEAIICAVGRSANTATLNLEKLNIVTDRNFIKVDQNYQTNIKSIYAIGDVNGKQQLAHVAAAQALDCIAYITNEPQRFSDKTIPYGIYTNPEIAYVGLSEEQLKLKQQPYQSSKFIMTNNGRHLIACDDRSFVKVIFVDDVIVGAQLFMENATEYAAFLATAIDNKLTYQQLSASIYPHPTISEGLKEAIENIHGEAIHIAPIKR